MGRPLFFISLYIAAHNAIAQERAEKVAVMHRRNELEELLKPRADIVLVPGCCLQASNVRIGVAGRPVKSLLTAAVYVDVPALGMSDRVLAWEHPDPDPERLIDIHHGRHHHTTSFASVGSQPGQFFFSFGYGHPMPVGAGRYEATICVKGRDALATERKMEIVFTHPTGINAHLR